MMMLNSKNERYIYTFTLGRRITDERIIRESDTKWSHCNVLAAKDSLGGKKAFTDKS